MPPTREDIDRRNKLFEAKSAPAALPDQSEVERRNRQFEAKRAGDSPKFLPAKRAEAPPTPIELQGQPLGETLERHARIGLGNAVGPGGAPGVAAFGLMLLEEAGRGLSPIERLVRERYGGGAPEGFDLGEKVTKAARTAQDFVQGGIVPGKPSESLAGKLGQEVSAAAVLAPPIRAASIARVAAGRGGRIAQGIARESPTLYYGSEAVGATGAAYARLSTEEMGWLTESAAALGGDATMRFGVLGLARLIGGSMRRLQLVLVEDIPAQEARMEREIYDRVRAAGGFEAMLRNPREAAWLHDTAERLERAAGSRENAWDAAYRLRRHEAALIEVGVDPGDVSIGALTENAGLRSLDAKATATNPRLAVHLEAGRQPGSQAVRDFMVDNGPPLDASDMDALRAALGSEASRRLRATDEALSALSAEADEAFGFSGETTADAALAARDAASSASTAFREALGNEYRVYLKDKVAPAYENMEAFSKAHPYLHWGVGNSKKAAVDVKEELASFSRPTFPQQYLTMIDNWSMGGVELKELTEARSTLRAAALRAEQGSAAEGPNFVLGKRLWKLRSAVIDDINNHSIIIDPDVLPRAAGPAVAGRGSVEGPENVIGLPRERSLQLRDERYVAARERMGPDTGPHEPFVGPSMREAVTPVAPAGPVPRPRKATPGKPGREKGAASAEDGVVGLSAERARAEMGELAETARETYLGFAHRFKDPMITGGAVRAARRHVPVEQGDLLGLYLSPSPAKTRRARLADLEARVEGNSEMRQLVDDWLVADAYQASVRMVVPKGGGASVPRLDPKALDTWQRNHAEQLKVFDGAKATIRSGAGFMERARLVGASPQTRVAERNARALEGVMDDPEQFWRSMRTVGTDKANRLIRDVIGVVRASGDPAAMMGLRESFWNHILVDAFAKGEAERGFRELTFSAVDNVLTSPQLSDAAVALEGPASLRTLRMASAVYKAMVESAEIPSNIRAAELKTALETGKELAIKSSVFSVILGPKRRGAKIWKTVDDFVHEMDDRHVSALLQEAVANPALRANLLRLNPQASVIRAIRHRMSLNFPTLFPRAKASAEKREKDEAEAAERRKRADQEQTQSSRVNRGVTTPPQFGRPGGLESGLGLFS